MRSLETMKRTSSAAAVDACSAGKRPSQQGKQKIPTTGIFAPEQLGIIADSIKTSRVAFEARRPHICPVAKCKDRYCYRSGLEAHMKSKHPGFPLPPTLPRLQSKMQELILLERASEAACIIPVVDMESDDEESSGDVVVVFITCWRCFCLTR
jgi:hypothetical protein